MRRRHYPKAPSKRQRNYLRYLERACDMEPAVGLSLAAASNRIDFLESTYRIIYDRQPAMR